MHITAWMLSGALLASQAAQGQLGHRCEVSVKDKVGAVVGGAHVHVYRDELFGSAFEQTFVADKGGTVRLSVVDGW